MSYAHVLPKLWLAIHRYLFQFSEPVEITAKFTLWLSRTVGEATSDENTFDVLYDHMIECIRDTDSLTGLNWCGIKKHFHIRQLARYETTIGGPSVETIIKLSYLPLNDLEKKLYAAYHSQDMTHV